MTCRQRRHPLPHFNPLPPHGGRRSGTPSCVCTSKHFNPLPPHGGRRRRKLPHKPQSYFNPLPPHGGRPPTTTSSCTRREFQSTPSAWRETFPGSAGTAGRHHFNPLPPHGGRRYFCGQTRLLREFQSTPSAWRETPARSRRMSAWRISIHSLRMEGDLG